MRAWLNTCTQLPADAGAVSFEDLEENEASICFTTLQAPAYVARYILGGYKAEYRFRIIYRVLPSDDGDMLDAVEALTAIAAWCESTEPPELDGASSVRIVQTTDVTIFAAYEDGSNDYYVDLNLEWEAF